MSKILVVDDDMDLAELVRTKLASEGHKVHTINTGEGAFETAKKFKPEIAILDIMLPGVTGYQICRKMRKDPELYPIAILLLTALGEEPEIQHGLEQGADDYLVKPFKLDKLMEKLGFLDNLLKSSASQNPITHLAGTDAFKRQVNHRLARDITIAACYIHMEGFKAYSASRGPQKQEEALKFMAKHLGGLIGSMGIYESFVAHMGGEHFVVLLNFEDCERFCKTLAETFDDKVKQLYTAEEIEKGFIVASDKKGKKGQYFLMALAIGVAHNQYREFKSAKKILEVLTQVRQKAHPEGKSVVFVDRRRAAR